MGFWDSSLHDAARTRLDNINLKGANLKNANLIGANLTGATWTNGQTCGPESIGTCNQ